MIERDQEEAYAYVLGLYLGDGYINKYPRTYRLQIYQDAQYPHLVEEYKQALRIVLPNNTASSSKKWGSECTIISVYSIKLPILFPQHGPGRKHHRDITLQEWQQKIIDKHPWRFISGLIHTDGCRYIRQVTVKGKTYEYPAYGFSNRSVQIRQICVDALNRVGVKCTNPKNGWQVHIYKKEDVALMDRHVTLKK